MKIILSTDEKLKGYEPIDIVVVDAILQPNIFKSRFEELKGRLTGNTKDFYGSLHDEAIAQAKLNLAQKYEDLKADGVTGILVTTSIDDIRGDVFIGAAIQAILLKNIGAKQ